MYFPRGYDHKIAIELGLLIVEAYHQFSLYEDKKKWTIPNNYKLISELHCQWKQSNSFDQNSKMNSYIKNFLATIREKIEIPIGFIAEKGNNVYLVFRGTQTATEWINNLNIKMEAFKEADLGNIHEGFLKSYKDFRNDLLTAISKIDKSRKLYITGHSLGGAFACLAAADIRKSNIRPVTAVYTFGSPRVGDKIFAQEFNCLFPNNSFRIANTADVVTEIPFSAPIAGIFGGYFTHVNTPVLFTEQLEDIEDNHSMNKYVDYLEKQRKDLNILQRLFRKFV